MNPNNYPVQPTNYNYYAPQPMYYQSRRSTNHALHIILSLLSFGLWLPIYLIVALNVTHYNNNQAREYDAAIRRMQYAQTNPQMNPQQGGPQR